MNFIILDGTRLEQTAEYTGVLLLSHQKVANAQDLFAVFNLKENDFIKKKEERKKKGAISLGAGECWSMMKPAEETNCVYRCRLGFRR